MKTTTKWGLLDLVCPHICRGCGELGAVFCERCKKYILNGRMEICPICKKMVAETKENVKKAEDGFCGGCDSPFRQCWVVGWREGALAKIVKDFKYHSVRAAGGALAELIDEVLPKDLAEMVVVPLPTIGKHVRERGIDHTNVLAKKLARRRGWKMERVLERAVDTVQVGKSATKRESQAERAYEAVKKVETAKRYLLVDDVWTTGATMLAAARVMRKAGAKEVYGTVIAIGKPEK